MTVRESDRAGPRPRSRDDAAEAQAALRAIAFDLVRLEERCQEVLEARPRSDREEAMFEARLAWELATKVRTVVESVGEDLRRVVESLEGCRASRRRTLGRRTADRDDVPSDDPPVRLGHAG